MDETIHINVELHKTDTDYIAVTKTRLWSYLPPTLGWLMKSRIPASASIQGGVSFTIINNLAILVEGFITDLLVGHLDKYELVKSREILNLESSSWENKMKKFKSFFKKDFQTFPEYQSIDILFDLRNNFSHGRTYLEKSTRDISTGKEAPIESVNSNYQKARQYLISRNVIKVKSLQANEVFWNLSVAFFLFLEVKSFLFRTIENVEFNSKKSILAELQTAYQNAI